MTDTEIAGEGLIDAITRLDDGGVRLHTERLIREGCDPKKIHCCLSRGLENVKELFEQGEYFIADLIYSGMLCHLSLSLLTDSRQTPEAFHKGPILIGVVEKDIHNIGKDIVAGLLSADGFDVIDLGSNVKPQAFVEAILKYSPALVLMSGMMHFARESMKETIEVIRAAGLRDRIFILLGGGCVDASILSQTDADAVASDSIDTLNLCNEFIRRRRS